jgi:hypothetical protein
MLASTYMEGPIGTTGETNRPILPDLVEVIMGSSASRWNIEGIAEIHSAGQSATLCQYPLRL